MARRNATTLIVVEDEPAIRTIVAEKLRQAGFDVESFADGEAGLRAVRELAPCAVVTDYEMPLLDGLSLARAMRADAATAHIPVILLTARGHRLSHNDIKDTSIRTVVMKPFSMRELVGTVTELVGSETDAEAA
ncbi:MAG: response regulator [Phycisphaerae bacterium]|nr:response regulator [Phycisphaerae bacterium]